MVLVVALLLSNVARRTRTQLLLNFLNLHRLYHSSYRASRLSDSTYKFRYHYYPFLYEMYRLFALVVLPF